MLDLPHFRKFWPTFFHRLSDQKKDKKGRASNSIFQQNFRKRKRGYKTPGKNRLLFWRRHKYLTIVTDNCALDATNNYIETLLTVISTETSVQSFNLENSWMILHSVILLTG